MKHPLRIVGAIGFLATLAVLAGNAARNAADRISATSAARAAFPVDIGELGKAETVFEGRVQLMSYRVVRDDLGRRLRRPTVRVQGQDPHPEEESWLRSTDVVMTFFAEDGETEAFTLAGPEARVAIQPGAEHPRPDTSRPWIIQQPLLHSSQFVPGKDFTLEAVDAEIDPQTRALRTNGHFVVKTEGLQFEGYELRTEPETGALLFGGEGEKGRVSWELTASDGHTYHGVSDGGGSFTKGLSTSRVLTLNAVDESVMEFPAGSPLPGSMTSRGLRLTLEPREGGWEPVRSEGLEFTHWQSRSGWLRGGPWSGSWSGDRFLGLHVSGPLRGLVQVEAPTWVSAGGGAFVAPAPLEEGGESERGDDLPVAVYLYHQAYLQDFENRVRADWLEWTPVRGGGRQDSQQVAGNSVGLSSPSGEAFCDGLWRQGDGGWKLLGNAVLYPAHQMAQVVSAPSVALDAQRAVELRGGFALAGWDRSNGDWQLTGETMETRRSKGFVRSRATGEVAWTTHEARFRGREFVATIYEDREVLELFGNPAVGEATMENGRLRIEAERMVLTDGQLLLSRNPSITIPARVLGLEGEDVLVEAPRVRRKADGAWTLAGGVRFSGGLQGQARSVTWSPEAGMELESAGGRSDLVRLSGDRSGSGRFFLEAGRMSIDPNGTIGLRTFAAAELQGGGWHLGGLAGEADRVRLEGENAELGRTRGYFDGYATIEAGELWGKAVRMDWVARDGSPTLFTMAGSAVLNSPQASGTGETINFRTADSNLRLDGEPDEPAVLSLKGGRVVTGEWLELDLINWLVSGGPGSGSSDLP